MSKQEKVARLLDDYIKQLGSSLNVLPARERQEIIQEVRGHLEDRLERCDTMEEFQQTLQEFGPPEEYAQTFVETYRASLAPASATPRQILEHNLRLIRHGSSVVLSLLALGCLYLLSAYLVLIGLLKPLFPESIGLWASGNPFTFRFGVGLQPATAREVLGYWIIPLALLLGVGLFVGAIRLSRLEVVAVTKRQDRRIRNLSISVFLLVLVVSLFVALGVTVVSGGNTRYTLETNRTGFGILILDNGASAVLMEDSNWIGLIVSKSGQLIVEDRVTIFGPVCLFSDSLMLGENARVRGSAYLFSGELRLGSGASVSRDAILFSGSVELGDRATIRDDVVLFSGDLRLEDGAAVQDDAFLFSGNVGLDQPLFTQE